MQKSHFFFKMIQIIKGMKCLISQNTPAHCSHSPCRNASAEHHCPYKLHSTQHPDHIPVYRPVFRCLTSTWPQPNNTVCKRPDKQSAGWDRASHSLSRQWGSGEKYCRKVAICGHGLWKGRYGVCQSQLVRRLNSFGLRRARLRKLRSKTRCWKWWKALPKSSSAQHRRCKKDAPAMGRFLIFLERKWLSVHYWTHKQCVS